MAYRAKDGVACERWRGERERAWRNGEGKIQRRNLKAKAGVRHEKSVKAFEQKVQGKKFFEGSLR